MIGTGIQIYYFLYQWFFSKVDKQLGTLALLTNLIVYNVDSMYYYHSNLSIGIPSFFMIKFLSNHKKHTYISCRVGKKSVYGLRFEFLKIALKSFLFRYFIEWAKGTSFLKDVLLLKYLCDYKIIKWFLIWKMVNFA